MPCPARASSPLWKASNAPRTNTASGTSQKKIIRMVYAGHGLRFDFFANPFTRIDANSTACQSALEKCMESQLRQGDERLAALVVRAVGTLEARAAADHRSASHGKEDVPWRRSGMISI